MRCGDAGIEPGSWRNVGCLPARNDHPESVAWHARCRHHGRMIGYLLVFVVCIVAAAGAARPLPGYLRWLRYGVRTTGVVVDEDADAPTGPGERAAVPVVEFTTTRGRRQRVASALSGVARWRAGHQVQVVYDPRDPAAGELAAVRYLQFALTAVVTFGAGVVALLVLISWLS